MIKRKIHIDSKFSREVFEANLRKGINSEFELMSRKILWGKIENHKISGIINPPFFISDPFRNRVKGLIIEENNMSKIELTVKFGWVNWIVVFLCYVPLITIPLYENSQNTGIAIEVGFAFFIFSFICTFLFYLKLIWDSNRLRNWIELNC